MTRLLHAAATNIRTAMQSLHIHTRVPRLASIEEALRSSLTQETSKVATILAKQGQQNSDTTPLGFSDGSGTQTLTLRRRSWQRRAGREMERGTRRIRGLMHSREVSLGVVYLALEGGRRRASWAGHSVGS